MKIWVENGEVRGWATGQLVAGKIWIHFNGQTFQIEKDQEQKSRRGKSASVDDANTILAPMPGKVTKIGKSKGDSVEVGDVVIVMEAMKMEYTLKSKVKGVVVSVSASVGDQVALGKILVEIEANK